MDQLIILRCISDFTSVYSFESIRSYRIEAFHILVEDGFMLPSECKALHLKSKAYICLQDIASEHPERFFIAEIIREKIFMQYRNEVPYASQVSLNL